ncbi:MAG: phage holin family protein [Eubacteriales bacterium]|nr:phage holin family protein [Eubacteriales bacterium]
MRERDILCGLCGTVLGFVTQALGGWDVALATLLCFMALDYVTGLVTAGVFHASKKTKSGALESNASFKGLCRKGAVLVLVLLSVRLDLLLDIHYVRDSVCIAFILSEGISILENICLMGVVPPEILRKTLGLLQEEEDEPKD